MSGSPGSGTGSWRMVRPTLRTPRRGAPPNFARSRAVRGPGQAVPAAAGSGGRGEVEGAGQGGGEGEDRKPGAEGHRGAVRGGRVGGGLRVLHGTGDVAVPEGDQALPVGAPL